MIEQKVIVFSRPLADKGCLQNAATCGVTRGPLNSNRSSCGIEVVSRSSYQSERGLAPRRRPQFILDMLLCFGECRQCLWTPPRTAFSRQNSRWSLGLDVPPQLQQLAVAHRR